MSVKRSKLLRRVGSEFLASRRARAVEDLLDMETLARQSGDVLSPDAWLDIAKSGGQLFDRTRQNFAGSLVG